MIGERLWGTTQQSATPLAAVRRNGVAVSLRDWPRRARAFLGLGALVRPSAVDERLLAGTRLGAAVVLLIGTLVDAHAREHTVLLLLVGGYLVHASGVFVHSLIRPERFIQRANLLQWIDLSWTIAATSSSHGTAGHVFPYFSFVLAAAAVRWGLWRSLRDGVLVLVVASLQVGAGLAGYTPWAFELDVVVVRVVFVVVGFGVVFGILAERLHELRFQAAALADLVSDIGRVTRLRPAVELALRRTLEMFNARQVFAIVEEVDTGLLYVWRARTLAGAESDVSWTQVSGALRSAWLNPIPSHGEVCEWSQTRTSVWRAATLQSEPGGRLVPCACSLPAGVLESGAWRMVLTTPVDFARIWSGTLYVCDPSGRPRGELRLRFLRRVWLQVSPALLNLYLLRRLRSEAGTLERARIARELHDGVLQSLAGLEMRLDVLRRSSEGEAPELTGQLTEVRDVLHEQSVEARELVLRLRPLDVDATQLHARVRDVVERFSRTVPIRATLDWAVDRVKLSPKQCREVIRIVQEGLFNVRRHSGATRVDLRVEADAGGWALIIHDDGHGFGFSGRMTHDQLEAEDAGPRVIRERVAALAGTLTVTSSPAGARLEMAFPENPLD